MLTFSDKLYVTFKDDDLVLFKGNVTDLFTRKQLIKFLKKSDFILRIKTKLKLVEYVDVILNSQKGKVSPCRKPNITPMLYYHSFLLSTNCV